MDHSRKYRRYVLPPVKSTKRQRLCLYLFLFFAFGYQLFYLIDDDAFPAEFMGLAFGLVFFAAVMLYTRKVPYRYGGFAVCALLLSVTSAWQCWRLSGQSFWLGIRPQRDYILCWLLYFPLTKALTMGKLTREDLFRVVRIAGSIQLALYILQYFVGETHMFLDIQTGYRYGSLRLYGSAFLVELLYYITLTEFVQSRKLRKRNLIEICVILGYIALIRKGRAITLSYAALFVLAILVWRGASVKKLLLFIAAAVVVSVVVTDEMLDYMIQAITQNSGDSSVAIRDAAKTFYLDFLKEHPLFGVGYFNTTFPAAAHMAGTDRGYYPADNGLLGYLFQYGLAGGVWNLFLFLKLAKDGIRMARTDRNFMIIFFLLYTVVTFQSGNWISYYFDSMLVVVMASLAGTYRTGSRAGKRRPSAIVRLTAELRIRAGLAGVTAPAARFEYAELPAAPLQKMQSPDMLYQKPGTERKAGVSLRDRLLQLVDLPLNRLYIVRHKVEMPASCQLYGPCRFTGPAGSIRFGENCIIRSGERGHNPVGAQEKTCFCTLDEGKILVGNHVGISSSVLVSRASITIDDDVMIGGGTKIYDNDFHSMDYDLRMMTPDPDIRSSAVWIKKGAFIGAHSIILKGVTIGEQSIVGAGSVVTEDIPDGEIWAGNPARFVRKVDQNSQVRQRSFVQKEPGDHGKNGYKAEE